MNDQPTNDNLRRRKILYIPIDFAASIFTRGFVFQSILELPDPLGLPPTAVVRCAFHDHARDAFGIVIEDPNFEAVPVGYAYPTLTVQWSVVKIPLQPKEVPHATGRSKARPSRSSSDPNYGHSLTPRVHKVLALSTRISREHDCDYLGTEHLLLGLLREGDGPVARILKKHGITEDLIRQELGLQSAISNPKP